MAVDRLQEIYYGGDYYPEQWDEKVWRDDIRLMKMAGVNLVSIGIFAWSLLQPDEKTFDFSWLNRIMDLLHENGVFVDLATATASQPAWASRSYPDILPVDEKGNSYSYGSRQTFCPNSTEYRRLAAALTEKIAERYKDHPALLLWHVNNEYGCHVITCYCKNCEAAFRAWLKNKYQSLERLNNSWGTKFWSQYYHDWDEVGLPRYTTAFNNPGQMLDYRRFFSDSTLELYRAEYEILKRHSPQVPVTTNFVMIPARKFIDHMKWAKYIDIASIDLYPDPSLEPVKAAKYISLMHDYMRGLKGGKPFILMEQAPSQVNWMPINPNKKPKVMRLWSYEALSLGADGIMFFQWRQSLKGAEKFHSAVVTHTGDENSRVFKEASILGEELAKLADVRDSRIHARAAIIFDFESWWAMENDPTPTKDLKYFEQIANFHDAFFDLNIPVDIIEAEADFSSYDLIVAPTLYMVKDGFQARIEEFVSKGGYFATSFFSGIANEDDIVFDGGYPGVLKKVLGIAVEEFDVLQPEDSNTIKIVNGSKELSKKEYSCNLWCDVVRAAGAETIAVFGRDYYENSPAVTANTFGKGKAYYIATQAEGQFYADYLKSILDEKGIAPVLKAPEGIQVSVREKGDKKYVFLLNHLEVDKRIELGDKGYKNIVSKERVSGSIVLRAKDAVVLSVE